MSNITNSNMDFQKVKCNVCHTELSAKKDIKTDGSIKTQDKPLICEECIKQLAVKSTTFNCDRIVSTGKISNVCPLCNKRLSSKGALKQHLVVHSGEKPHVCFECKASFNNKGNLQQHFRVHTGEKPYACKLCNKQFNAKCNLTQHLRIHTGEKRHVCKVCNKQFTDQSSLSKHCVIHTGEKPHVCQFCSKQFAQKGGLKQHLLHHTGEKPHVCDLCNLSFTQKRELNNHLLKHRLENRIITKNEINRSLYRIPSNITFILTNVKNHISEVIKNKPNSLVPEVVSTSVKPHICNESN